MNKMFIGVDPGKSGAIAYLHEKKGAWSTKNNGTLKDQIEELMQVSMHHDCFAVLEVVHSSPQMGVKSAFTFGQSYGQLEAALITCGISFERIRPAKWQGDMQCRTKGDKNVTKRKAQELFPDVKITHANADALLLAEYARRLRS